MPGHRFYAPPENFGNGVVTLLEEEAHHGMHVLRLRTGDSVFVFDGVGQEYSAFVASIDRKQMVLTLGKVLEDVRESSLQLTLAAAVIKGDRFEWVIQKAVELGVMRLIPLVTEHTETGVVRQDSPSRRARWARIVLEATKQSGRRVFMKLEDSQTFPSLIESRPPDTCCIMFVERSRQTWADIRQQMAVAPEVMALVGPEGGWSSDELESAHKQHCFQTTLGPRILRAETASVVAVSLIQHYLGDLA